MNVRELEYIISVAETRHFGKAAQRCFVTQSTLSGQIKKLEEQLGVSLFERNKRHVEVTEIGEQIVKHARLALEQIQAIQETARIYRDPLAGNLRLGVISTLSPYLMPLVLAPLRQQHPQLQLILSEELSHSLIRRLKAHEIDAALLATPIDDHELNSWALFDEPFWLAHPRDHVLYTQDEITEQDLCQIELLLLDDGHCLTQQVMDLCKLKQRPTSQGMGDLRAASLETLLQLVGAGMGCTVVPALATRGYWTTDSGIIARKVTAKNAARQISLVFRRSFPRTQALTVLSHIIKTHLPNTVKALPLLQEG